MRNGITLILIMLLTGCGVELLTTTAIQGELQAEQMKAMKRQVQNAADTSGRINLERAISTYQAEKGTWPASLDALVPDYLQAVPVKADGASYNYDPNTGKLLDGAAAAPAEAPAAASGPTEQDTQVLDKIQAGIDKYAQDTGYYPATIDQLYPYYVEVLPRTSAGEHFVYDNQTGYVDYPQTARPATAPRQSVPRAGGGVGAGGPMGEVMTGIGMQQELNGMSHSGTSAASTYTREKARGTTST
nr:hypothetical protein [Candidatus Hydrogenedentota bacterium]